MKDTEADTFSHENTLGRLCSVARFTGSEDAPHAPIARILGDNSQVGILHGSGKGTVSCHEAGQGVACKDCDLRKEGQFSLIDGVARDVQCLTHHFTNPAPVAIDMEQAFQIQGGPVGNGGVISINKQIEDCKLLVVSGHGYYCASYPGDTMFFFRR